MLPKSLKIILLVLVAFSTLGQGHRFDEEVNELVAGDSMLNKKNVVLFTGSSSIRVWTELQAAFPKYNVINRGFGGSEMADLSEYVDRLIVPYRPRQIFIYEGDNDLAAGKSPEEILVATGNVLNQIRAKLPAAQVLFISPKPSIARWGLRNKYTDYNRKLAAWIKQQKSTTFIDVWTPMLDPEGNVQKDLFIEDGLHMNSKGYNVWKKVIGPYLK